MATDNLLKSEWATVDPADLDAAMSSTFSHGQLEPGGLTLKGHQLGKCSVRVRHEKNRVVSIEPGPAFDLAEWKELSQRISSDLLDMTSVIGRAILFSSYPVQGNWQSDPMNVQMLPPPPDAPVPPVAIAEHPFVIEFPLEKSGNGLVTILRRGRKVRALALILNCLLEGRISRPSASSRHFWIYHSEEKESKWEQEMFSCPGFVGEAAALSKPQCDSMKSVPLTEYFNQFGREIGRGLRVPSDLEVLLTLYFGLSGEAASSFDRALYWLDISESLWGLSHSAAYGALVTTVEALIEDEKDPHVCSACGRSTGPGPTRKFKDFLEQYAPGDTPARTRSKLYSLRSALSHGGRILGSDVDMGWGLNASQWEEDSMHRKLRALVRIALVNWLSEQGQIRAISGT